MHGNIICNSKKILEILWGLNKIHSYSFRSSNNYDGHIKTSV